MKKMVLTERCIEEYVIRLRELERSENTVRKYRRDVMKLKDYAGEQRLDKNLVISFKEMLAEKYELTSVNSILAALNGFFEFMDWRELCVKQYKIQKSAFCPQEKELTRAEYIRLVERAEMIGKMRLSLLIQTVCSTGIRIGELMYITVESLETGEAEVSCKGKHRLVFLTPKLREKLREYARSINLTSGAIFITANGRPIDRSNVWKEMKRLCKYAGISKEKIYPHNLRHLFARSFYEVDKDLAKLADVLGHSNINTTRIYTISSGSEHRKNLEKMELVV